MTRQGRSLPKTAKVSAVGKRVRRVRHVLRDNWAAIELTVGVLMFVGLVVALAWGFLVLLIGSAPLNR